MKIGLFLQDKSPESCNQKPYDALLKKVKKLGLDLFVFPEGAYTPFAGIANFGDIVNNEDFDITLGDCHNISEIIEAPTVFCGRDQYRTAYNIYVDAKRTDKSNTFCKLYMKHTDTEYSPFYFDDYSEWMDGFFDTCQKDGTQIASIMGREGLFGAIPGLFTRSSVKVMTISCGEDCDFEEITLVAHARALECNCFVLAFSAGGSKNEPFAVAFAPDGQLLKGKEEFLPNKKDSRLGCVVVYDTEAESFLDLPNKDKKEAAKVSDGFLFDISALDKFKAEASLVSDNIWVKKDEETNVVLVALGVGYALSAEKTLQAVYSASLKELPNKKYILAYEADEISKEAADAIMPVLELRALENNCAVVLCADENSCCIVCEPEDKKLRPAYVKTENGAFEINLALCSGPEGIWAEESLFGAKPEWRENYEKVVNALGTDKPVPAAPVYSKEEQIPAMPKLPEMFANGGVPMLDTSAYANATLDDLDPYKDIAHPFAIHKDEEKK